MNMSEAEYRDHCESYDGYCKKCDDVGRFGDTEPDAENYPCEECGQHACMGIEQALLMGLIEITDNEE